MERMLPANARVSASIVRETPIPIWEPSSVSIAILKPLILLLAAVRSVK